MKRFDIINTLIEANGYHSYLEIGLNNPSDNYIKICCVNKESVDPYDKPEHDKVSDSVALIRANLTYRMTSDEMFRRMPTDKKYDIIFIDGLHEYLQVARDITNSFRHLNYGGVIIIHDGVPQCEDDTINKGKPCRWLGDVYKTIVQLDVAIPEYYSIDEQHNEEVGMTFLKYFEGCENVVLQPADVTFAYYMRNVHKLNIRPLNEVLNLLKRQNV